MAQESSPTRLVPDNRSWRCSKCGEVVEAQFDSCWRCSEPRNSTPPQASPDETASPRWRLTHHVFRGDSASWDELFSQAAEFATELGPERVVNVSHSADQQDGVVVVWYWTDEEVPASE